MSFSDWWITKIIRCSSLAFLAKKRFVTARGFVALYECLVCVIYELLLLILSLPLLISTTHYVVEEGKKTEFKYRRLTIILVLLALSSIWLTKGFLVVVREFVLQKGDHFTLHSVRIFPAQAMWEKRPIAMETLLFPPRILGVYESGSAITIYGDSTAQSRVSVFLDDLTAHRTFVMRAEASVYGSWSVSTRNDQGFTQKLPPGRYSISALAELPESQLHSMPSVAYGFNLSQTWWDRLWVYSGYVLKIVIWILLLSAFIVSF